MRFRLPRAPRASYVPKGAIKVASKRSSAVAYLGVSPIGKPFAVGFFGKADAPAFNYSFRDEARRAKYVSEWFVNMDASASRKQKALAEKKAALDKPHGLKVGDVLRSSWGYDQTNIDYYQVVELRGKRGVVIREIGAESQDTGFMQGNSVPAVDQFCGEPVLKKVGANDEVKVRSFAWAHKMEKLVVAGVPVGYRSSSWTAYA
jgi:hypothetical protein